MLLSMRVIIMDYRSERDSLWGREIPKNALYGIQALRARENYSLSGEKVLPEIISAYCLLKKSAAQTNAKLGKLDERLGQEISEVCDEIIAWKYREHFIVDSFQAWAGTSTNMNVNEVITNKILENRGEKKWSYDIVSPNDHINMSQSTNDSYPTVMRISLVSVSGDFIESLESLVSMFDIKAWEFHTVIKSARTHLQDAVPITLGQEFQWYADTLRSFIWKYTNSIENLKILSIWWSAAGTGINTHPEYQESIIKNISQNTWVTYKANSNMIEGMQSQRQVWEYMWVLKDFSLELTRIMNDLRLISSGPHTGLWEINLPAVQPGSSIMPGKVNPSILEAGAMVCYKVIWSATSIDYAMQAGQLNLNVMMPLMAHESISSTKIMTHMLHMLTDKCIWGISANIERCEKYAHESNGIFTALNPILWYQAVADLIKQKEKTGRSLKDMLGDSPDLSSEQIDELLDPLKLANL